MCLGQRVEAQPDLGESARGGAVPGLTRRRQAARGFQRVSWLPADPAEDRVLMTTVGAAGVRALGDTGSPCQCWQCYRTVSLNATAHAWMPRVLLPAFRFTASVTGTISLRSVASLCQRASCTGRAFLQWQARRQLASVGPASRPSGEDNSRFCFHSTHERFARPTAGPSGPSPRQVHPSISQ